MLEHIGTKPATCTENGRKEYFYCTRCGLYYADEECTMQITGPDDPSLVIQANGHSMTHVGAVEPTYDHVGNIEYWYCSACRKYFADGQGAQELTGSVILPKKEAPSSIVPILPLLDEEESGVFRRGRNTAPHSVPRAASREEYQTATALEALFGWLYLKGRTDRLNELFSAIMAD